MLKRRPKFIDFVTEEAIDDLYKRCKEYREQKRQFSSDTYQAKYKLDCLVDTDYLIDNSLLYITTIKSEQLEVENEILKNRLELMERKLNILETKLEDLTKDKGFER